ncbi:MAG TPA: hypothetical protein VHD83_08050 [Puia sp.]|nr:hypothetical protein [Puia sp.]
MRNKIIFLKVIVLSLATAVIYYGCSKVVKGYLSDHIFYQVNPFSVQQGQTTVSSSLVANGSTTPLNVSLLGIYDAVTGEKVDSMFMKPQTIQVYTGSITYLDSTLDLLNAKIKDSVVSPFSINSIGGRLQFTAATKYVVAGKYTVGIRVSNIRGGYEMPDACTINLTPISRFDSVLSTSWTTLATDGTSYTPSTSLQATIVRDSSGPEKIVFKFWDKNGNLFNPAAGEVTNRTDGRPTFHDWDPYYPEVKTDTSIEYQYPEGINALPLFQYSSFGSSFANGICYYLIPGQFTDINQAIRPVITPAFYVMKGMYTVNLYLNNVVRVP